ncbi:ciliary-associated calcium-binding coiled-coil protein 1 isoform X1 [Acipenser oxyrinchus oxyrinchus]|uniref:Ciliary-associated calcium-binding coiled-coil protein 1 isoform X1 n=1 Tax=Acipenser oxyrinchus oxyrinchus TaxID=40147 RepID=A0AAD8D8T1_ACIOX|nr:ciliary-associated calcium-binding coiled-coil protein 1 isoform X1 [Acipenser oxyrinchus oxyrinchus]
MVWKRHKSKRSLCSLVQHYKLYEFLFSQPKDKLVQGLEENIEVIKPTEFPFPAPLEEGLSSDIYSQLIEPAPAEQNEDEVLLEIVGMDVL